MRLSFKMMIVFSIMMFASLALLSTYASRMAIEEANAYTEARFHNMAVGITRDLESDIGLMRATLNELQKNTSFMAALNQMVRDDSSDQKMRTAAAKAAEVQLYQSPLVDNYYRVSFYTTSGLYVTNRVEKDSDLISGSEAAANLLSALPWLPLANEMPDVVLHVHDDPLTTRRTVMVYGIGERVFYAGKPIGYLELSREVTDLDRLKDYIDENLLSVQVSFQDGSLLYTNAAETNDWPQELTTGELTTVSLAGSGHKVDVLLTEIPYLGLNLYISEDSVINTLANEAIRQDMFRRAAIIMLPTLVLIALLSLGLSSAARKLTKKVRAIPVDMVAQGDEKTLNNVSRMVTKTQDHEIHEIELAFNTMMRRLHESTVNEMTLREGALQARLSALQTQINPHFIYNTLNIISAKSMESGNFDVIEICDQFAQMLRYSTDTRSSSATMAEEIENVRSYLMLAKARYEDNLEFVIDVPENLAGVTVPKLTLQPLVENALNHGFDGTNVLRRLRVKGWIEGDRLMIEIRDNGTGFNEEMLQSLNVRIREIEAGRVSIDASAGHIGLVNTCLRLHYYSGGQMHIAIRNEDGAVITITVPYQQAETK